MSVLSAQCPQPAVLRAASEGQPRGQRQPVCVEWGRVAAFFLSPQVMQVVREQITRALPSKPNSLDQFKSKLRSLSYSEILRLRQSERMSQDDFQSPPIV